MEQLARIILVLFFASAAALAGSLWLLHTAFNDGNVWKGLFSFVAVMASGWFFVISAGVFRP